MKLINILAVRGDDDSEVIGSKQEEQSWAEDLLAFLWASEKGFLLPVGLADVPETVVMNHTIRGIKEKLRTGKIPAVVSPVGLGGDGGLAQMELMAASSQNLVSILNRMQDGKRCRENTKGGGQVHTKSHGTHSERAVPIFVHK